MHSLSDAEKCNAAIMCCVNCYRGFVFTLLFTVMHTLSLSTSACYHVLCKLYLGFYRVLKVQSNITLYYDWYTATAFLSGTQYKLGAGWHLKRCNKMLQLWFWWLVAVSPAPVESTTMKFTKTKCKTCQAKRPGSRTTMCRPIIFHRLSNGHWLTDHKPMEYLMIHDNECMDWRGWLQDNMKPNNA